jgi:hypothetical protein
MATKVELVGLQSHAHDVVWRFIRGTHHGHRRARQVETCRAIGSGQTPSARAACHRQQAAHLRPQSTMDSSASRMSLGLDL